MIRLRTLPGLDVYDLVERAAANALCPTSDGASGRSCVPRPPMQDPCHRATSEISQICTAMSVELPARILPSGLNATLLT